MYFLFLFNLSSFYSLVFSFFPREDRDPDGCDPLSLPVISGTDVLQETKQNHLEDAQGILYIDIHGPFLGIYSPLVLQNNTKYSLSTMY